MANIKLKTILMVLSLSAFGVEQKCFANDTKGDAAYALTDASGCKITLRSSGKSLAVGVENYCENYAGPTDEIISNLLSTAVRNGVGIQHKDRLFIQSENNINWNEAVIDCYIASKNFNKRAKELSVSVYNLSDIINTCHCFDGLNEKLRSFGISVRLLEIQKMAVIDLKNIRKIKGKSVAIAWADRHKGMSGAVPLGGTFVFEISHVD